MKLMDNYVDKLSDDQMVALESRVRKVGEVLSSKPVRYSAAAFGTAQTVWRVRRNPQRTVTWWNRMAFFQAAAIVVGLSVTEYGVRSSPVMNTTASNEARAKTAQNSVEWSATVAALLAASRIVADRSEVSTARAFTAGVVATAPQVLRNVTRDLGYHPGS